MMDLARFFDPLRLGTWNLANEANVPPLDEKWLRRYVERTLSAEESRLISQFIVGSALWRNRYVTMCTAAGLRDHADS